MFGSAPPPDQDCRARMTVDCRDVFEPRDDLGSGRFTEPNNNLIRFFCVLLEWDERRSTMGASPSATEGVDGNDVRGRLKAGRALRAGLEQGPGA